MSDDETPSLSDHIHAATQEALRVAAMNPGAGPDVTSRFVASAVMKEINRYAPVDPAAVLLETADALDAACMPTDHPDQFIPGVRWVTGQMRRIARAGAGRAAVSESQPAAPTDAERVTAVADILRHTAGLVDRADLPQTSEDTSVFHDGARWATAEVRRVADAVTSEDSEWRPDGLAELAQGFGLNSAERAMLRFALELAEERMLSRGNEFAAVDHAALESLKRLTGEGQ